MRVLFFAVLALIAVGCGGPGGFDGKVSGTELKVSESLVFPVREVGNLAGAQIVMTNSTGLCDRVKAGRLPKDSTVVLIRLNTYNSTGQPLAVSPGEYPVATLSPSLNVSAADFSKFDAQCRQSGGNTGRTGLVKLSAIKLEAGGSAQGTFDITFGAQNDKTTGSFNATFCDAALLGVNACE